MFRVVNEIAFVLLTMRRTVVVKCMSRNNNACIGLTIHAHIAKAFDSM
jgi:hypothetical protein